VLLRYPQSLNDYLEVYNAGRGRVGEVANDALSPRRTAGGADIGFYVGDQATRPTASVRLLSRPGAFTQENVYATRRNGKQAGGG